MKKTFTILGLIALATQINAQSSVILTEDFEDQQIDLSIGSSNPNNIATVETGFAMNIQYNSVDIPYVSVNVDPGKGSSSVDSITIMYDVDIVNVGGGFDGGSNSVYYTDMVSVPYSFGSEIVQFTLYMTGQDYGVSDVVFEGGKAFVTKGYSNPFFGSLSMINFDFQKSYQLGVYSGFSPEEVAKNACNAEFSNPNEIAICESQVVANAPTIQGSLLVDNITVTTHTVTGIEGESETDLEIVKAFNLLGMEVSPETANETLIVIYSNGSSERIYNLK